MPRGNGTGPQGMGAMTGRGLGFCAGYTTQGFANPQSYGMGRGMAYGRGGLGLRRGRCGGFGFMPPMTGFSPAVPVDEEAALSMQMNALEQQLAAVKERLSQIDSSNKAE